MYTIAHADKLASWDWAECPSGPPPRVPARDGFEGRKGNPNWRAYKRAVRLNKKAHAFWVKSVETATEPQTERIADLVSGDMPPAEIAVKVGVRAWNAYAVEYGKPIITPDWSNSDGVPREQKQASGTNYKTLAVLGIPLALLFWG